VRIGWLAAFLAIGGTARANPASLVPTLGSGVFTLDYEFEYDRSHVQREQLGGTVDPNGPIPLRDEFVFHQYQHTLTPHADVGIAPDTWFSIGVPIIIAQSRDLQFASGVDATTSTTVADGILPATGIDASTGSPLSGSDAFKGVTRYGVDQIAIGFGVAPMNQARDDTKPTWKIGADLLFAVGKMMVFTPETSPNDTGVSKGVHSVRVWTTFDRHIGWAEPWARLFYEAPFLARDNSPFADPGFGSTNTLLGQKAGAQFGFEAAAIDDKAERNRISLDLGSRVVAHFDGRDYSEMWEVFAYSGDANRPGNPLILDADPTMPGLQAMSHPGITNVENYLEVAASMAIRAELGEHVRFAALGELVYKTDHAITFADSGIDLPTCSSTVTTNCETDNNDVVNPGTREVNPLHVDKIDLVGHRYHSTHNFGFVLGVQFQARF
jgi:hypothetical protein